MSSTRSINYAVRANKHVERRMIIEALQRADRLEPRLTGYHYVGFGGIFFTDFLLVHRQLGISSMTSIERSTALERFEFNQPLRCIDVRSGSSTEILPGVLGNLRRDGRPAMIWLDYDGGVDQSVTADARLVSTESLRWSIVIFTLNCQPHFDIDQRVADMKTRLGDEMPPYLTKGAQLGGWKLAEESYRLVQDAIHAGLSARNGPLPPEERLVYKQLFRFHYADNAKMLTQGGIFCRYADEDLVGEAFAELSQVRQEGATALLLDAPVLTGREVRHLLGQLPATGSSGPRQASSPGLPPKDAAKFVDMYRHYPLYAEIGMQ